MRQPDTKVLRAFAELEGEARWTTIQEYLKRQRAIEMGQIAYLADPCALHQHQGRYQALNEFLELAAEARSALAAKLKRAG